MRKYVTKVYIKNGLSNKDIPVNCPYCPAITTISRIITEPACNHFEDFTLFRNDGIGLSEVDGPDDPVVMIEAVFRKSGSRYDGAGIKRTGEIVRTEKGLELMVDGKTEVILGPGDSLDMVDDEEDYDVRAD